jgi:hypothetical protein
MSEQHSMKSPHWTFQCVQCTVSLCTLQCQSSGSHSYVHEDSSLDVMPFWPVIADTRKKHAASDLRIWQSVDSDCYCAALVLSVTATTLLLYCQWLLLRCSCTVSDCYYAALVLSVTATALLLYCQWLLLCFSCTVSDCYYTALVLSVTATMLLLYCWWLLLRCSCTISDCRIVILCDNYCLPFLTTTSLHLRAASRGG